MTKSYLFITISLARAGNLALLQSPDVISDVVVMMLSKSPAGPRQAGGGVFGDKNMGINFKELDLSGTVNGEQVDSIARWFEDNPEFCGPVEIEIAAREVELYRICVKKEMTLRPMLTNLTPLPASQMVGKLVGNFAGFYIMDLHLEDDRSVRWRGKIPKNMILQMEKWL